MSEASVHTQWMIFLSICGIEIILSIFLSFVTIDRYRLLLASSIALYTTAILILTFTKEENNDGQSGIAIGMFLVTFLIISYVGLLVGNLLKLLKTNK